MSMMEHEARIAAENTRDQYMRDNTKLRRVIQATHKRAVEHKDCDVQHCPICEGGLFQCADCGAAEIEAEERVCTGPKLEYYNVDRFDASAIMFSLDGREPKPSEKGAWVRASDHDELASRTAVLERFRPHWAQGYSSDSIAAQAQTAALSQIWEHLGATSQTEAMQKLSALSLKLSEVEKERDKWQAELGNVIMACPPGTRDMPINHSVRTLRSRAENAEASLALAMANQREQFDALCAMRNDLNELFTMPSIESDLLDGPETSVFCSRVVAAVRNALISAECSSGVADFDIPEQE